jgi:transcriptional regulator GlxA family with amidase domain
MTKVAFFIPQAVELLDLAGPIQVFREAKFHGLEISMEYLSIHTKMVSSVGLTIGGMKPYQKTIFKKGDFLIIAGFDVDRLERNEAEEEALFVWLRKQYVLGVNICSVCTGAFVLGAAGLLNGMECTTHWRSTDLLKQMYPQAKVLDDRLFVKSDNIYTSAGISAGIDLALFIVEELKDALLVYKVTRGLVLYHRRGEKHHQQSIYLSFRNHINPKIHQIQDYLVDNLAKEKSIELLAEIVGMSERNLGRVFKEATGLTVMEYITKLRVEHAKMLRNNASYTLKYIAAECGLKSERQLQRILKTAKYENDP